MKSIKGMREKNIKLVINIDDFGPNDEVVGRTFQAFSAQRISRASAIVNIPWGSDVLRRAQDSGLPLGVHLNMTTGKPLSSARSIATLVSQDGVFKEINRNHTLNHIDPEDLEREFSAQIERFLKDGLKLSHIDNHRPEIYFNPKLFKVCIALAGKYKVPLRSPLWNASIDKLNNLALVYAIDQNYLSSLQEIYHQEFINHQVRCTDAFLEDSEALEHSDQLTKIMDEVKGTLEVCIHLGGSHGARNLEFLLSEVFAEKFQSFILSQRQV